MSRPQAEGKVNIEPQPSDPNTNEDDTLGIDKLSVDYEYLLYKIHDYIETIQLNTIALCQRQNEVISNDIIEDIIDNNIKKFKELLAKCDNLESHFDMLDQLETIVNSFDQRLISIDKDYRDAVLFERNKKKKSNKK